MALDRHRVSGRSRGRVAVVGQDGGHALRLVKLRATSMEAAYPTELGARRTQRLSVSVPFHCPLLSPVAAQLVAALEDIEVKAPKTVYVGNRRARALYDAAAVREELGTNVSHPVLWSHSTRLLYELGARTFIEAPPGATLTGLIVSASPDVRARAAAQAPLDGLVRSARRL